MEKRFNVFGKIAYDGKRKINAVSVDVRLTEDAFGRPCLGISADIWNSKHTDCVCGGQCLDEIAKYKLEHNQELFDFLYYMWQNYHLNDMHAGTPEQEEALSKGCTDRTDYKRACEYLEAQGLYEVEYHGLEYNGMYRYGSAWLYRPIDQKNLDKLLEVLELPKHD